MKKLIPFILLFTVWFVAGWQASSWNARRVHHKIVHQRAENQRLYYMSQRLPIYQQFAEKITDVIGEMFN